jgi:hypothetical protein
MPWACRTRRLQALYNPYPSRDYFYNPRETERVDGPYVVPREKGFQYYYVRDDSGINDRSWSPSKRFYYNAPTMDVHDPTGQERMVNKTDRDPTGDWEFLDEDFQPFLGDEKEPGDGDEEEEKLEQ